MSNPSDYLSLPDDLPVPENDGACDGLVGRAMPSLSLPSTMGGELDLAEISADGTAVLFVYPRTGRPGEPLPDGWDLIPGARGCTPQSCAFRDLHGEIEAAGAHVFGASSQDPAYQLEFAERIGLRFPLLSDEGLGLAATLGLPTFEAAGMTLYKRVTLIAREGEIVKVFYPVFPPNQNAADVLAWLGGESVTPAA